MIENRPLGFVFNLTKEPFHFVADVDSRDRRLDLLQHVRELADRGGADGRARSGPLGRGTD